MNKKSWLKIISTIIVVAITLTYFVGCYIVETGDGDGEQSSVGTVVINDFSDYEKLYQIIPKNMFGKIDLNTDKTYVLTGEGSAKLEPDMNATSEIFFKQRLTSKNYGYKHGNINMATKVSAQMYNASTADIKIQADIEFSNSAKATRETTVLKPGVWTTVNYKIYPELLSLRFNTEEAMYVNYYVERKALATQPVIYLDNVSISYTDEVSEPIEIKLDEGEFCSFDKNYQMFLPYLKGWGTYLEEVTELTLSADPKYTVGQDGYSYKVHTLAGSDVNQSYWIHFPNTLIKASKLDKVTKDDKMTFSVYNKGPECKLVIHFNLKVPMKDGTVKSGFAPTYYDEVSAWSGVYGSGWGYDAPTLKANDWTEIVIDFGVMEEMTKECYKQLYEMEDLDVFSYLDEVAIGWSAFNNVAEKTFYIDDMKIVKGQTPAAQ